MNERLAIFVLCLSACGGGGGDGDAGSATDAFHTDSSHLPAFDTGPGPDTNVDSGPTPDAFVDPGTDAYVAPGTDAGPSDTGQWVMGYYVGYQIDMYPVDQIDWSGLTHIALAPMAVNADGTIDTTFSGFGTNAQGRTFAQGLSSAAHAHGVHPMLMLGGAGESSHVLAAMNADMSGFVTRLLGVMDDLGFDGIDLDVEADGFAVPEFTRLASALRAARPSMLLSLPGAVIEYGTHPEAGLATLVGYLDRYFIQSYYGGSDGLFTGSGPTGGFQSWFGSAMSDANDQRPFAIDHSFSELVAAGVPAAKLGMGVAFYAACYLPATTPPGGTAVTGPRQPTHSTMSYCWDCGIGGGDNTYSLSDFFASGSTYDHAVASSRMFDTLAGSSYLSLPTAVMDTHCGGRTQYIVYETPQSLQARGDWSRAHGYGGVIIWTIQQGWLPAGAADGMAQNALMQALRTGFIAP